MWLITNFGFFSAVERRPGTVQAGDNRTLQIRAREKQHLDILREKYMGDELGPNVAFKNSDYQVRAYCTPEAFGRAMYQASLDIDYSNFKSSVHDKDLHDAAFKVWNAFADVYGTNYTWESKAKSYPASKGSQAGSQSTSRWSYKETGTGYGAASSIFQQARDIVEAEQIGWDGTGSTVRHQGQYQSAFGPVEGQDDLGDDEPMFKWTRSPGQALAAVELPYGHMDTDSAAFDGDFVDEEDMFPEHNIDALIEKYAPFVAPETLPNKLGRADAIEWLGTSGSMFKRFLAGNKKWRTYKTGSQNQYQFPKDVMGEMQEHFDIWMSERLADQRV